MDAEPRSAPAALSNEAGPRARGGEDHADALGVEAQGAQGHVAIFGRQNHVLHGTDLSGRQLAGHGARTWRAIGEAADYGDATPRMVSRWRQTDDPQHEIQGQGGQGARDRAEDAGLGRAFGETLAGEAEPGGPQEREQKAHCRGQNPGPLLQLVDGGEELLAVVAERFEADDGARTATLPTGDGRARDVQSVAQPAHAGAVHVLAKAVVVRAAVLRGRGRRRWCHRGRIAWRGVSPGGRAGDSSVISSVTQLRTRLFGMSSFAAGTIPPG